VGQTGSAKVCKKSSSAQPKKIRQPIVINTERIITAAPAPPDGQGTRITFTNGGHQDVKELIADVLRRLNIRV